MAVDIQTNTANLAVAVNPKVSAAKDSNAKKDVENASQNNELTKNKLITAEDQAIDIPEKTVKTLELPRESVQAAVNKLQDYVDKYNRDLKFSIDDDTGRTVVRLLDSDSKVVKQYPSEEVLSLINNLEQNKGLFIGKA